VLGRSTLVRPAYAVNSWARYGSSPKAVSLRTGRLVDDTGRIEGEVRITGELGTVRDLDVFVAEVLLPLRSQNPKESGVLPRRRTDITDLL
jgi:hypothetical protein